MAKRITIDWNPPTESETCTATWRTWESQCGQYQVREAASSLDGKSRFYAMRLSEWFGWTMIEHMKTYKTQVAAEKAIKKWVRSGSTLSKSEVQLGIESRRRIKKPLLRKQRG